MPPKGLSICISMNNPLAPSGEKRFRFKQFSLTDAGCAMKIGTDGVLLGSIAASSPADKILDVGTGCGLIALMIAQKSNGKITAIDVDSEAVAVASQNVKDSPWPEKIRVVHARFQDFAASLEQTFDMVVCNPPFFHNSLLSPDAGRNIARHAGSLPPDELLAGVKNILTPNGNFWLVAPAEQENFWLEAAEKEALFCGRLIRVLPKPGVKPKRIILCFSPCRRNLISEELTIETGSRHQYTEEYKTLTRDYYLHF